MPKKYNLPAQLPSAAFITRSTNDGHRIVFANEAFFVITGYDQGFVIGSKVGDLLRVMTADTASAINEAILGGPMRWWRSMCRRTDGSEFPATIILDVVEEVDGQARQYLISILAAAAPAPHRPVENHLLHSMYDSAPGFIAMAEGPEHRFTYANPSYLRLVGRTELVGSTVKQALPELVDQGIIGLLDQVYRTGSAFVASGLPISFSSNSSDAIEVRYLNFVYQAVRNIEGEITGLFCEGYDVTPQKLAADELLLLQTEMAHSSRLNAMGMMAGTIAHELNQPLAAISSFAAGSARLLDPASAQADGLAYALRAIEEAAQKAGDIIRNVRELTKRGETPRTMFALKPAIAECVKLIHADGCAGIHIQDETPKEMAVFGDRTQVQQVLINLLRNACDATEDRSRDHVKITSSLRVGKDDNQAREAVVCVADAGKGLSNAVRESLFTWTDSSKHSGMGLGLAISRNIIEAHNGDIWVGHSSDAGTQFCFSLPASAVA